MAKQLKREKPLRYQFVIESGHIFIAKRLNSYACRYESFDMDIEKMTSDEKFAFRVWAMNALSKMLWAERKA